MKWDLGGASSAGFNGKKSWKKNENFWGGGSFFSGSKCCDFVCVSLEKNKSELAAASGVCLGNSRLKQTEKGRFLSLNSEERLRLYLRDLGGRRRKKKGPFSQMTLNPHLSKVSGGQSNKHRVTSTALWHVFAPSTSSSAFTKRPGCTIRPPLVPPRKHVTLISRLI